MPRPCTLSISGFSPFGKFRAVDGPVAQPGMIAVARAEPAIVHHETLDADARRLLGQRHLPLLVDRELGGFPAVVEDGAEFRRRTFGRIFVISKRCSSREAPPMP